MENSTGSKIFIAGAPYRVKNFSSFSPDSLRLQLHISPSQFDYVVEDKKSNKVLFLQPYQNANTARDDKSTLEFVRAVLSEDKLLKSFEWETRVKISEPDFTVLPKEFSTAQLTEEWKKMFTSQNDSSILFRDQIDNLNIEVLYSVPSAIVDAIKSTLKNYKLEHSISSQLSSMKNEGSIFCNAQSGFMQLIYFSEGQLQFANIFSYGTAADFIYYLLATYHTLHLDPEKVKVDLAGEIVKESELFRLMYKYIRHIEFANPQTNRKLDDDYPFPPHFYFSLFC